MYILEGFRIPKICGNRHKQIPEIIVIAAALFYIAKCLIPFDSTRLEARDFKYEYMRRP